MDIEKQRSRLQENLVSLYLRLNGYFLTGFIVHSPIPGKNKTEVDIMAVRFPHSSEPERKVECDPLLEVSSEHVDLIICEVKSKGQRLQFNDALLQSTSSIESVLRWAGMFQEPEVPELARRVQATFAPADPAKASIPTVIGPRDTRVRGILCSPEYNKQQRINQPWFIPGSAIISYISQCLCPEAPRAECATAYDFGAWDKYEPIVRHFKERSPSAPKTITDLYESLVS